VTGAGSGRGSGTGRSEAGRTAGPVEPPPPVAVLCREYTALAAAAVVSLADFLDEVAALAVRLLPTARSARIRVRDPQVVTAEAAVEASASTRPHVLAIPLVGRGELAGLLELAPSDGHGFPEHERELAEVLAVLLTLSLGAARAA
jgi:GAF domain-containing protein